MEETPAHAVPEYAVNKQRVELDIDFAHRSLKGSTEIEVQPLARGVKEIRLFCRQCKPLSIQVGGITARWEYDDPYRRMRMSARSTVHQHRMLKDKIKNWIVHVDVPEPEPGQLSAPLGPPEPPEPELVIELPAKLKIQELRLDPATALAQGNITASLRRQESEAIAVAETPVVQTVQQQGSQFAPIKITIDFEVDSFRDGIHWIGIEDGDVRYPHLYTKNEPESGNTSCIFPCVDDATSRCGWELAFKCPKTLGDAFRKPTSADGWTDGLQKQLTGNDMVMVNSGSGAQLADDAKVQAVDEYYLDLSDEDKALDLTVLCVGDQIKDETDSEDDSRHTITFKIDDASPVTARHVAFAVGPFDRVILSDFRESEEEERLGSSAIKIEGYFLPGRQEEVKNTCFPVHQAIDFYGLNFGSYPFSSYQMLFVDDLIHDHVAAAGLSICSTRLLFPEDIIEPLERNTRVLMRAVADQWMGVSVIAKDPEDAWVVAGIAGFMTDLFMKKLCGNNEYRWHQKQAAQKVYDLDADRPSLHQQGRLFHIDQSIRDFVNLKSASVLFILDRRLMKASGSTGVTRIINKIFLNAKTGSLENGQLSTDDFKRTCERLGHNKLDSFFKQWVYGTGCPIFEVKQRFNKKKLVVEMVIQQHQMMRVTKPEFAPDNFMREIKEDVQGVWAPDIQPVFTGPMTIRIHEADGTPYEHIVEIKEATTKIDIPYNTKYKRLKRSKRQKERQQAAGDATGDAGDDALLYCLGDILDTPQEVAEWRLMDWAQEDLEKMGQESYEWIRVDADFEWIGKIHLVMPTYMYVSQLQQDRDLVAQLEALQQIIGANANQTSLSILVRTLMDRRYFHGIRVKAAEGLAALAKGSLEDVGRFHLEKAFQEMFCYEGSVMPRPNDFSSRVNFIMQCAIPKAMAKLRDSDSKVPLAVRRFFVDKLKFNDNSNNDFSDVHYVATLMSCLAESLLVSHREAQTEYTFSFGEDEPMMGTDNSDADFEKEGINEIERYRRIDEWISTYQNIYSTTALQCLQNLTRVGIAKDKTVEIVQYTRGGNADNVRLAAFQCLVETQLTRRMAIMKYLLHSLADAPSPYFRDQLLRRFGEALGHIALGDAQENAPIAPVADSGLVVEPEISQEARHLEVTRKNTPESAVAALKAALGNEEVFKQALWYATTSSAISLNEAAALADVAALLYEANKSHIVSMRLPRGYNKAENKGKGTISFFQHGPYRISPSRPLAMEDWQALQANGLRYEGPLAIEVTNAQKQDQAQAVSEQLLSPAEAPNQMLPPTLPTSTIEKPKVKLNLGANKRKQSLLESPREGSPKAAKISRQQTPSGIAKSPPRRSPSVASRRGSTPGSTASASKGKKSAKLVTWRWSLKKGIEARKILSLPSTSKNIKPPPQPTVAVGDAKRQPSRSITSSLQQQSSLFPQALVQSPTSPNHFISPPGVAGSPVQAQPFSLGNVGGFRSFDSVPEANLGSFRSFGPPVGPAEVKQENIGASNFTNGLASASPAAPAVQAQGESAMPPPPTQPERKKTGIKLKLGKRPTGDEEPHM